MALNVFTGSTTANWSAPSWSLNRIPTSTDLDTAYFGPLSPSCSVDFVSAPCYNFDCSTYTRQLNLVQNLSIYGTYSSFGPSASFRFTSAYNLPGSTINIMGSCSIISNGYAFKREGGSNNGGAIRFAANSVSTNITFLDQFEGTNIYVSPPAGNPITTLNGATISARENFITTTNANMPGTAPIQLRGTGSTSSTTLTIFATNPITNSIYVNTPGSVNVTNVSMTGNNNIFKYISGTLSITTFIIYGGNSSLTIDIPSSVLIGSVTTPSSAAASGTVSFVNSLSATNLNIQQPANSTTVNYNFYGGWSVSNITHANSNTVNTLNINLSPTASWYINNSMTLTPQRVGSTNLRIQSTLAGTKAPLIVSYGATQDIFNTLFVDIDASGGATILPYQYTATFSNVSNIIDLKGYNIMTNQIQTN